MLLSFSQTQGFFVAGFMIISSQDYVVFIFKIGYRSLLITRKNKAKKIISLSFCHFVKYYYKSIAIGHSQKLLIIKLIAHSKIHLKVNLSLYLEQDLIYKNFMNGKIFFSWISSSHILKNWAGDRMWD